MEVLKHDNSKEKLEKVLKGIAEQMSKLTEPQQVTMNSVIKQVCKERMIKVEKVMLQDEIREFTRRMSSYAYDVFISALFAIDRDTITELIKTYSK